MANVYTKRRLVYGSIDWYCYPHFDSPSVFGAILDDKKGGRFQISADAHRVRHKQFYWPSTNVLVTRFLLPDGIAELEDFMPVGLPSDSPEYHHIYRRIRCVRGSVRISLACRPSIDECSCKGTHPHIKHHDPWTGEAQSHGSSDRGSNWSCWSCSTGTEMLEKSPRLGAACGESHIRVSCWRLKGSLR
jgi:GH15 family glucan-1,4-alpha-glucosidase